MLDAFARHGLLRSRAVAPAATSRSTATTSSRTSGWCSATRSRRRSATSAASAATASARCRWTRRWRRRWSTSRGGRTSCGTSTGSPGKWVGGFDGELAHEFFQAFANRCQCNLHLRLHYGDNAHHIIEALCKAFARATADAARIDPRVQRRAVDQGDARPDDDRGRRRRPRQPALGRARRSRRPARCEAVRVTVGPGGRARRRARGGARAGRVRRLRRALAPRRAARRALVECIRGGKPYLGICLGLQVLFERARSRPAIPGLGVFRRTRARACPRASATTTIGATQGAAHRLERASRCAATHPVLDVPAADNWFYFVHSYHAVPDGRVADRGRVPRSASCR